VYISDSFPLGAKVLIAPWHLPFPWAITHGPSLLTGKPRKELPNHLDVKSALRTKRPSKSPFPYSTLEAVRVLMHIRTSPSRRSCRIWDGSRADQSDPKKIRLARGLTASNAGAYGSRQATNPRV
jgi:hypothetical protein